MPNPTLKEVPVDMLQFGMFVAELDRPWTETPFMFQGFVLRTEQQLVALRKYCKRVYVDPEKRDTTIEAKAGPAPSARGPESEAVRAQLKEKIRGQAVYAVRATVEEELPRAQKAFTQSRDVVQTLSQGVRAGKVLDAQRAKVAVTDITTSVVRNPDAMMLLAKMREKSAETLDRSVNVSVYMTAFGRFLQLPQDRLEILSMMGLLQDSGMLKLPVGVAEKRSKLTAEETEVFKTHVSHSVEILSKTTGLPADLPALASLHHERYDGSGYPRGLKGNAIPLLGSIAAIVDTFDTLTAPPPYGEHLSPSAALSFLFQNRGTKFHAGAVEQFIQCVGAFPVGSVVELNSGEIGVVVAQNMVRRLQPRVMVVQDEKGNPVIPYKMLDLMTEPKVSPNEVYRIRRTLESDKVRIDPKELFL